MPGQHARYSPSAAHRWMRCPASLRACEGVPDVTTEFAAEGTLLHEIIELCLDLGLEPEDFLGKRMSTEHFSFEITQDHVWMLEPMVESARLEPGTLYVEQRVSAERWVKDCWGTLDTGWITRGHIKIRDNKFGSGVVVEPRENEQLMIYALAFWDQIARHETKAKTFHLWIDQPRVSTGGGVWTTDLDRLLRFAEELQAAYEACESADPEFVPGEKQCTFCPIRHTCGPRQEFMLEVVGLKFDDLDEDPIIPPSLTPGKGMTPERRSYIVRHRKLIEKWLERLHAETLFDAISGKPTPGQKAVAGRAGRRNWRNEKVAAALLKKRISEDQLFTKKLISPSEAEKMIPPKNRGFLTNLVVQSEGKPVLVDEDDPKPAIRRTVDKFDDIEEIGDADEE